MRLVRAMKYRELTYWDQKHLAETMIDQFLDDNDLDEEIMPSLIELLQGFGLELDACSICGAMPMNTNCNNAGCDV